MVYILLGEGFEETEAVAPCDILRRGGADVRLAGVSGLRVRGSHGITVAADCLVSQIRAEQAEMLVLPGGTAGVASMAASRETTELIRGAWERGVRIAAICAAPTLLAKLGILDGKNAVCYPGLESECAGAHMSQASSTVRDGRVITGRGPGASFDFGFRLLEELRGAAAAEKVRGQMCAAFSGR